MNAARTDDRVEESPGEWEPPEGPGEPDQGGDAPDPDAVRNWTVLSLLLALISFATAAGTFGIHDAVAPAAGAAVLGAVFAALAVVSETTVPQTFAALDEAWDEHRLYVGLATGLFGVGVLLGAALVAAGVDLTELFMELLAEEFGGEEFAGEGEEFQFDLTATFFIVNNTPPFLMSIFGALTLGLLTVLIMVVNGVLVGNIVVVFGTEVGFGLSLALIAPHGVFELAALFVAAGVGFRFLHRAIQRILGSRDALFTKRYLLHTTLLVIFAWLVLVLAAFIEAYMTIPIAEFLFDGATEAE